MLSVIKALSNNREWTLDILTVSIILQKCDGQIPPPDFVIGPATEELANMIIELMEDLECE